ncbi:MAG: Hint domain-containing protein [Roseovarius sp.]|nr:Hint domain-containing protein [Roseovarius sp.]
MTIPRWTAQPAQNTAVSRMPDRTAAPERKAMLMRKYRTSWQADDGRILEDEQVGPALPLFESAFSAFARGTLITTTRGPVAIEDLTPGMRLVTAEHGPMPVSWIGSMTLAPANDAQGFEQPILTRIMADAFGIGRPMADFLAGPGARILTRPRNMRANIGGDHVLTPVRNLADGVHATEIRPQRPVSVYHLCLRRHATIIANGLEAESFHPAPGFERSLGPNMLRLFLGLFPHIREPHQFGTMAHMRLPLSSPEGLEIA